MRRCCAWLLVCAAPALWCGPAAAKPSPERAAIEATFTAESAACRERFVVTSCLDEAARRRREALGAVQQREQAVQSVERQRVAAERRMKIENKQRAAAERRVLPAVVQPASPKTAPQADPRAGQAGAQKKAPTRDFQRKAAAHAERESAALEHRELVEQRNAQRAAERPRAAPLPVPGAASR